MKTTKDQALELTKKAFGFVPNLMSTMADANPAVAAAYLAASEALGGGTLSAVEKQLVMLAASAFNDCHYCTAAHRTAAKSMGILQEALDQIDSLNRPADARMASLVEATWSVQRERGWVEADKLGVTREELVEIIAIVGLKTITNYLNHIAETEIDPPFQAQATRSPGRAA